MIRRIQQFHHRDSLHASLARNLDFLPESLSVGLAQGLFHNLHQTAVLRKTRIVYPHGKV